MITVPRDICIDLDRSLSREWLVTNGIGGYASGTVPGANTRRYHGLLVAALRPPVERTVLLNNLDEDIYVEDRIYYLGTNEYRDGKINPGGFVHIEEFRLDDGIPTTVYRLIDEVLHKTVWMEHGHNTTYIRYSYVEGTADLELDLHPMCNYRDYHSTTEGSFDWDFEVDTIEDGFKVVARKDAQPLWLTSRPEAEFSATGVWYWNFVYRGDVERGYTDRDDLYSPGVVRITLKPGDRFTLVASVEPPDATSPLVHNALQREQARRRKLLRTANIRAHDPDTDPCDPDAPIEAFRAALVRAADDFIVNRELRREGAIQQVPTVIAGYHWFTDWGRDTMISLPGLCIPTGRVREANKALRTFALYARDGLIPNNFPDVGELPHYNTADATLWLFSALERLVDATGNLTTARGLYALLSDAVAHHLRGTRYGIYVDEKDGLLCAGEEGVQLTWMDAKVDDWVVTPRRGKPVEINALWYNALRFMAKLKLALGGVVRGGKLPVPDFGAMADQVQQSFRERFWYNAGGYLYDVVDGPGGDDLSLRPNQVFALSLCPDLLTGSQARSVLTKVRQHLVTPYGLRTLSPGDPAYIGLYRGDRRERDAAYHMGTVWTWLLGPYFDAVAAVDGVEAARTELEEILPALRRHMGEAGLGTMSEIFDGDEPHAPAGCIAQAWSVAEVLRVVTQYAPVEIDSALKAEAAVE